MTIYTSPQVAPRPDVFLAGGISGTEDWQAQAAEALSAQGLEVANPRRPGMLADPSLEPEQIRWEHDHLSRARTVLFWFPGPGDHPVAMYELGYWLAQGKDLIVGCPQEYKRRVNLQTQVDLVRPDYGMLSNTLLGIIEDAAEWAVMKKNEEE